MARWISKYGLYVLFGLLAGVLLFAESAGIKDFDIFLGASRDLLAGKDIYTIRYHEWYHYYYDTLFALLISPLTVLPLYWANFVWLTLNMVLTYRIWRMLLDYLPNASANRKRLLQVFLWSFAFSFHLWHKNIHLTQATILILWLSLEGLRQVVRGKPLWAGVFIGLGISVKIMPVVLIPYLLYRGEFKAATLTVVMTAAFLIAPGLVIGMEFQMDLLESRWALINPQNAEHLLDVTERSFHSITTLLATLLVEHAGNDYTLDVKRNVANVDLNTLTVIINSIRFLLVALTLYFLRSRPFVSSSGKLQTLYEISYVLLITPLIFPHQQHYAFFFALPCIVYLIHAVILGFRARTERFPRVPVILLGLVLFFLLNSHFLWGAHRDLYDHFKTLTYGILLLIPCLALLPPIKVESYLHALRET